MKKKRQSFSKLRSSLNPLEEIDNERYNSLIEEGYSDTEIAREFNIDDSFIKRMREEWREDY